MNFDLRNLKALVIKLYGRPIAIINRLGGDRYLFSFTDEYIADQQRPTLSLSFKGQTGELIFPTRATVARLSPFFSNLLPEGPLRTYLAERAGVSPRREFFLLAALGADLPGALAAEPATNAEAATGDATTFNRKDHTPSAPLRFSLAGIQLKFSAIMEASGGLTIPADGRGGSWIVKLPSARFNEVPENEYAMLALARGVGIATPQAELTAIRDIGGLPADVGVMSGRALAVRRFDRNADGSRVHMEDFAQVFGIYPENKYRRHSYANIAAVLRAEAGEAAVEEFLRRLVFSVLIGNADMHLKNWSLLYPDRRRPVLAPAYDLVATLPYIPEDRLALTFGGSRSLSAITPEQTRRLADKARLSHGALWPLVRETAERSVAVWEKLPEKELLSPDMTTVIDAHIHAVARTILNAQ